jgi:hypothetical protein
VINLHPDDANQKQRTVGRWKSHRQWLATPLLGRPVGTQGIHTYPPTWKPIFIYIPHAQLCIMWQYLIWRFHKTKNRSRISCDNDKFRLNIGILRFTMLGIAASLMTTCWPEAVSPPNSHHSKPRLS